MKIKLLIATLLLSSSAFARVREIRVGVGPVWGGYGYGPYYGGYAVAAPPPAPLVSPYYAAPGPATRGSAVTGIQMELVGDGVPDIGRARHTPVRRGSVRAIMAAVFYGGYWGAAAKRNRRLSCDFCRRNGGLETKQLYSSQGHSCLNY